MLKQFFIFLFVFTAAYLQQAYAQITVKGTVYDSSGTYPIQLVSVLSSTGRGTVTDADGAYSITLSETDSIWFSYLNKPTRKFPVKSIKTPYAFNISLQTFIAILPEVKAKVKNYKLDSIQNREDYAKIFNYERPGLKTSTLNNGSVGFDLESIINSFRFRKNRNMLAFQDRLITQEQDAYVKYRFNKALIRRITEMDNDSLINQFVIAYQPSYLFTSLANDYTFHKYIKDSYLRFKSGLGPTPLWREGDTSGEEY